MSFLFSMVYLLLDALWLSNMTPVLYRPVFERIQKQSLTFKVGYAAVAYILLLATMFLICIPLTRAYEHLHPSIVFAMVGLSIYGVYNMTNAAVLGKYTAATSVVDTAWGTISFAFMGWMWTICSRIS
jgi:uncharacterized membrane protein